MRWCAVGVGRRVHSYTCRAASAPQSRNVSSAFGHSYLGHSHSGRSHLGHSQLGHSHLGPLTARRASHRHRRCASRRYSTADRLFPLRPLPQSLIPLRPITLGRGGCTEPSRRRCGRKGQQGAILETTWRGRARSRCRCGGGATGACAALVRIWRGEPTWSWCRRGKRRHGPGADVAEEHIVLAPTWHCCQRCSAVAASARQR